MDDPTYEHVYILPSDCIQHFLAQGITLLEFGKIVLDFTIRRLNETPRGISIARKLNKVQLGKSESKKHFNIAFLEWKDNCENQPSPIECLNFHYGSLQLPIFCEGNDRDLPECTYPVAIGPKGKSHDVIEAIIKEDLIQIRTKACTALFGWSGNTPPYPCTYSADLFMSLGDQPERRGGNVLQLGNSRNHARWRHDMDFNQVIDAVPACPICFEAMTRCNSLLSHTDRNIDNNAWAKRECSVCSNWMYDLTHPLLTFQRSEYFPKDYKLGGKKGTGPLCPVLLTYSILTKVIQISFEMVSSGK
jgi:hypothetical protein